MEYANTLYKKELDPIAVAADAVWGEQLAGIMASRSTGDQFGPEHLAHNSRAKAVFFADPSIQHPDLIYPEPNLDDIRKVLSRLSELGFQIERKFGDNNPLSQLYMDRIDELRAEQVRMIAIWEGDFITYAQYERFLYGEPNIELFDLVLAKTKGENVSITPEIDQNVVRQHVESVAPGLEASLKDTKNGQLYQSEEIIGFFQSALSHIPILSEWEVVVGTGRNTAIAVNNVKRQIIVPPHKTVTFDDLKNLVFHELVGHAVWREQTKKSKLKILQIGLDRVDKVSEGVATVIAQTMTGNSDAHGGIEGYLAVGLALGLDRNGVGRDFRDVFDYLVEYYQAKKPEQGRKHAVEQAWSRTMRTFRGVPKGMVGLCSIKQKIYLDGNMAVAKAIAANPEFLELLANGRYDPTNERHVACLRQAGIL